MSGSASNARLRRLSSMSELQSHKLRLQRDIRTTEWSIKDGYRSRIESLTDLFGGGSARRRRSGKHTEGRCSCGCEDGNGRRGSRWWNIALDLFYGLGGMSGMVRSANYGYELAGRLIESYRRRKYERGCR